MAASVIDQMPYKCFPHHFRHPSIINGSSPIPHIILNSPKNNPENLSFQNFRFNYTKPYLHHPSAQHVRYDVAISGNHGRHGHGLVQVLQAIHHEPPALRVCFKGPLKSGANLTNQNPRPVHPIHKRLCRLLPRRHHFVRPAAANRTPPSSPR